MAVTRTYGDFRIWNVLVGPSGDSLVDYPDELCWDVPWRDICALLTSIDYAAERPRNVLSRLKKERQLLTDCFLDAYFHSGPPARECIDQLKVSSMLASLQDLKESKSLRDVAARLWISRRARRIIKTHITPKLS